MASVKAMFRASTVDAKQGVIYFQIIHNRVVRQLTTDYHIFSNEWDGKSIQTVGCDSERRNYLKTTGERIDWDLKLLRSIVNNSITASRDTLPTTSSLHSSSRANA